MTMSDRIDWGKTLWVNGLRIIFATIIWMIITSFIQPDVTASMIILPAFYLGNVLVVKILSVIPNPIGWFFHLMAFITIVVADPVMFLLNTLAPSIVPVVYYPPIYGNLLMVVYEPQTETT